MLSHAVYAFNPCERDSYNQARIGTNSYIYFLSPTLRLKQSSSILETYGFGNDVSSKLFPMHVFDRSRTRPAGSISMQRSSMFESGSIDKLSMYKCKSEILTVLLVSFSS